MLVRFVAVATLLSSFAAAAAQPFVSGFVFESEVGPTAVLRNTRQAGDSGTSFTAADLALRDNLASEGRLTFEARLAEVHGLRLTWAPLSLSGTAQLRRDVRVDDTVFPAGTPVSSLDRFDGYRLGYLYRLADSKELRWDLGVGLQLRNESHELRSLDGKLYARDSTLGPVPLLETRLWWAARPFWMSLEASGFTAGSAGTLYDAAFTLGVPLVTNGAISPFLRLRAYGGRSELDGPRRVEQLDSLSAVLGIQLDLGGILRAIGG